MMALRSLSSLALAVGFFASLASAAEPVPIVKLPSALRAERERGAVRPAAYAEPPSPSPTVPELLPLPTPVPEPTGTVRPIAPLPLPPVPTAVPSRLPQPGIPLQPLEPRHNVKSSEPLPPAKAFAAPVPSPLFRTPSTPPPGDFHMPLSIRRTALSALLGTALVAGSLYADGEPQKKDEPTATKKDLDETNKLLGELKQQLAELKTKELAAIKSEMETLKEFRKKMLDTLEGTADKAGGDGLVKKIGTIDDKLTALAKQLDAFDKKLETTRTALSSPLAKETPKFGTVKLVNMYPTDVDILVNGKGYRLSPSESKTLSLAPGPFTYQLLTGGGEEKKRTIKESEEVLLKVN